MNKLLSYSLVGLQVVTLLLVFTLLGGQGKLGGDTNFDSIDVTDGYKVDGTTVIDGSGNVDAPITSTAGTFSTTLGVTGLLSANGGIDVDSLSYGSATTTIATSTAGSVMTAANVCDYGILYTNPDWSSYGTTTLPTATALVADCLDNVGDTKTLTLVNATVGTTSTPVIAGGTYATGTTLYLASSTTPIADAALATGAQFATIVFQAFSNTAVKAFMTIYTQ